MTLTRFQPQRIEQYWAESEAHGGHFELVNDVELKGIDFKVMGSEFFPFTGSFNGNGHTISHLTIKGGSNAGLFARLGAVRS